MVSKIDVIYRSLCPTSGTYLCTYLWTDDRRTDGRTTMTKTKIPLFEKCIKTFQETLKSESGSNVSWDVVLNYTKSDCLFYKKTSLVFGIPDPYSKGKTLKIEFEPEVVARSAKFVILRPSLQTKSSEQISRPNRQTKSSDRDSGKNTHTHTHTETTNTKKLSKGGGDKKHTQMENKTLNLKY